MTKFIKTKKKKEIVDITDLVNQFLKKKMDSGSPDRDPGQAWAGATAGLVHIFCKHTTCAITTADLDAGGTDQDYLDAFEALMPKLNYRHPHNPDHVVDHILSSIIGPGVMLPVLEGELNLGVWQRVVLVELDGPREREVVLSVIASD
ncbi:MAG: secondary thiamine-phosphate synthase enzyme YjbQ [Patescibacteria group bacterium]